MPKAGLFAGEVTPQAPADDAPTDKQKGYWWMEYGRFVAGNCSEVWDIGVLTPDLHVAGVVAGVWDGEVIIGTGDLEDDRVDNIHTTNDIGSYTDYAGFNLGVTDGVAEVFYPECQWYNYAGPLLDNQMAGTTFDLSDLEWTPFGTPTFAFADGLNGVSEWSVVMTDNNPAGTEGVFKGTAVASLPVDTEPFVARFTLEKATAAQDDSKLIANRDPGGGGIEVFFNLFTGVAILGAGIGPNQAFEVRDNVSKWEVFLQTDADNSSTRVLASITTSSSSGVGDIRVFDVAVFVHRTIGMVRGGAIAPVKGAASPSSVIDISNVHIPSSNHDNLEGGYYFEWRPLYSHSEISRDVEILSLNDSTGLLYYDYATATLKSTDGTNTAVMPLTLIKETKYRIAIAFGDSLMKINLDGIWGTEVAYDDAFAGGADFTICRNPEAVNYWRELRGYQTTYAATIAEIDILMVGNGTSLIPPWSYASLLEAESSGDPWVDGDHVYVTNTLFVYKSSLAVSGYSGLIHKYPWDGTGVLGTFSDLTVRDSEGADTDPDTWVDWTDNSTGAKSTDYEFDTDSNLSRLRDLTIAGKVNLDNDYVVSTGDTEVFRIMDDISLVTTSATADWMAFIGIRGYRDASTVDRVALIAQGDATELNWIVYKGGGSPGGTATSKTRSVPRRIWMYVKTGQYAVWFDDDILPDMAGTDPADGPYGGTEILSQIAVGDTSASTGVSTLLLGTDVFGKMETV